MRFMFKNEADRWACINALRTACHQYQEHAKEFREYARSYEEDGTRAARLSGRGAEMITANGAKDLADQFEKQANDVDRIIREIIDDEDGE